MVFISEWPRGPARLPVALISERPRARLVATLSANHSSPSADRDRLANQRGVIHQPISVHQSTLLGRGGFRYQWGRDCAPLSPQRTYTVEEVGNAEKGRK